MGTKTLLSMAPLMGITSCIYRNAYSRIFKGYDYAVAPFIASSGGRKSSLKDILPERNHPSFELIPQILSKNPNDFIALSKKIFFLGYKTINWNLGCPFPRVRNKMRGGGLLPHSEFIVSFLEDVIPKIPTSISLKVRLGNQHNIDLLKLLPLLDDFALEEIIIHPRTSIQMYKGNVDLASFEKCLTLTKHKICYSGDINSLKDYLALTEKFPSVNRWMIGRGGVVNPFLPEEIKGIYDNENKIKKYKALHGAIFSSYNEELDGPAHLIDKMKGLWYYWSKAFSDGERIFLSIARTKSVDKYQSVVDTFFKSKS